MRLTISDRRGRIARGETHLHNPKDDLEVIAAAKRVAGARGRDVPAGATIEIEEPAGRGRWRWIRDLHA